MMMMMIYATQPYDPVGTCEVSHMVFHFLLKALTAFCVDVSVLMSSHVVHSSEPTRFLFTNRDSLLISLPAVLTAA